MKEGQQYHDECGIPAQKCLKPDAVPMLSFKAHRQKDELKKVTMAAAALLQVHKVVLVLKDEKEDW